MSQFLEILVTKQHRAAKNTRTSRPERSPKPTQDRSTSSQQYTNNKPKGGQGHNNSFDRTANQMRQALELWQQWLSESNWYQLDRWLKNTLGRNKKYGKRDRLFYGDVLFNATRFGYWAALVIEGQQNKKLDKSDTALMADFIGQFAEQAPTATAIKSQLRLLALSSQGAEFLSLCQWRAKGDRTAVLPETLSHYTPSIQAILQLSEHNRLGQLAWHGIPVQYFADIEALSVVTHRADAADDFLAAQDTRPPLWLRLNHIDKKDTVFKELSEFYTVELDGAALSVVGERGIFGLECYKTGLVEIQDWASQQLALKVAATPGQKIWDTCAGGGGKTLAIAAPLGNKGAVWATDIREHKLNEVKRRAKQAHFYNIRTAPWEGKEAFRLPKEIARDGGFDWVLVDGPCSSSGTWRRNPDAKLRNLGEDLTALNELQLKLLTNASLSVKPGGKIVYGTCSIFECENNAIVQAFLSQNTGWRLDSAELMGCPDHNSDSLFAAVMTKIKPE